MSATSTRVELNTARIVGEGEPDECRFLGGVRARDDCSERIELVSSAMG